MTGVCACVGVGARCAMAGVAAICGGAPPRSRGWQCDMTDLSLDGSAGAQDERGDSKDAAGDDAGRDGGRPRRGPRVRVHERELRRGVVVLQVCARGGVHVRVRSPAGVRVWGRMHFCVRSRARRYAFAYAVLFVSEWRRAHHGHVPPRSVDCQGGVTCDGSVTCACKSKNPFDALAYTTPNGTCANGEWARRRRRGCAVRVRGARRHRRVFSVAAGQGTQWAVTGAASEGRVTIQYCFYQSTPLYMVEWFMNPLDSVLLPAMPPAARPPVGAITNLIAITFNDFEAAVPPAALFVEPSYCHC